MMVHAATAFAAPPSFAAPRALRGLITKRGSVVLSGAGLDGVRRGDKTDLCALRGLVAELHGSAEVTGAGLDGVCRGDRTDIGCDGATVSCTASPVAWYSMVRSDSVGQSRGV